VDIEKERNTLQESHVKGIGFTVGVHSDMGQGYEGGNLRGACVQPSGTVID
jgi:hypothetical protein